MVKTLRSNADRYAATQRVTLTGAAVNIVLATAQLIGGVLTHSQGLIADGVHTVSDLASDFLVLLASRHAHREADIEHPYGHGRIETLATSILGLTLILVAGGILIDVVRRLQNPEQLLQPTPAALVFAALAVISKESLYQYTRRVAKRVRSSLLEANAWHHRSDAISSLIVIVGITGSLLGLKNFDAFAALVVAMFIGHIGWRVLWRSGQELIDASLDEEIVAKTRQVISEVDGVVNLHLLRTRRSGGDAFADVHIQVPSTVSVSEGHQISEAVRKAIINQIEQITDVTIHTDPEDDAHAKPCDHLPLREEIIRTLEQDWAQLDLAEGIEKLNLHYLNGEIHVDVYLNKNYFSGHDQAIAQLRNIILSHKNITQVEFYFHA
jgi:cation diffusion facilitator family transporter